ncbi:hypothetical protein EB118_16520 [bacterium]|jgi:hypothetical protein|nr:hypothetical protein [Alphaproteobacteria bacterium]NDG31659.1 hypothetical protein [bacterium]
MKAIWNKNINISSKTATYTWSENYAPIVHEGGTRKDGSDFPARPWVWRTVGLNGQERRYDIVQDFNDKIRTANSFDQLFEDIANKLDSEFRKTIEAEIFTWDAATKRKNGITVTTPRDIVDLGFLRDSQSKSIQP